MADLQRKGIDHDPIRPWVWGTLVGRQDPVEVVSYPIPGDDGETIMVRMRPGDPTTIEEVSLKALACFSPDRHEWSHRPRRYYSDNPTVFHFTDHPPTGTGQ